MDVREKFANAREQMRASCIERDAEIELLLNGLVAGEHVCFVGEPGTAKSYVMNMLSNCFSDVPYFHILMTKSTNAEEVYGPIDIQGIRESRFERVIDGYLPTAGVFCGDEIWKSASNIINILLTAMEERKYKHGKTWINIPLRMTMAASNEWPVGEGYEGMVAAFDRFLLRKSVRPVSPARRPRLLYEDLPTCKPILSNADIDDAIAQAAAIPVGDAAKDALAHILDSLHKEGILPGDRRIRKSVKVAKAAAWHDGVSEVLPEHLEPLKDCLWVEPQEQPLKTAEIVCKVANPIAVEINGVLVEFDELYGKTNPTNISAEMFSAQKKMRDCVERMEKLAKSGNQRAVKAHKDVETRMKDFNAKMVNANK